MTALKSITNPSNAARHHYLQGYDSEMEVALDNAATARTGGFAGPVTTDTIVSQIHLVSRTVASAHLTFSTGRAGTITARQTFLVTAVSVNDHWMVSWASQCAVVQAANQPCPATPRGIRGTVPVPSPLDSAPAASSDPGLVSPGALGLTSDGSLLIVDTSRDQILRRAPSGTVSVLAGDGLSGSAGTSGPAVDAQLRLSAGSSLAVSPNGTIYFTDTGNNRIEAVTTAGMINTVAGTSEKSSAGAGGPAIDAALSDPTGLALSTNGTLYVATSQGVDAISPSGTLSTVVTGGPPYGGDIEASGATYAFLPIALALDGAGNLDVFSFSPKTVFQLPAGPSGPDAAAIDVLGIDYVNEMATAPDGSVVMAVHGGGIERIVGAQIEPLFDAFTTAVAGYGTPGTGAGFIDPQGVAVAPDGTIYADTSTGDGYSNRAGLVAITPSGRATLLPVTSPLAATLPVPAAPGFPAPIYPAALSARPNDGLLRCPSPNGVIPFTPSAIADAKAEAANFGTSLFGALQLSDRSWWPELFAGWNQSVSILGRHTVERTAPAGSDLAAAGVASACGKRTLEQSLVLLIGRSLYSSAVGHLFFVDRNGSPLLYYQGI